MVFFPRRLPPVVGWMILAVLAFSLVAALDRRGGGPLDRMLALVPADVWHGELWRLVTWTFVEPGPWELIMGCLALYRFGIPLVDAWGRRRFLRFVSAIVLASAAGTCLLAAVVPRAWHYPHLGGWALGDALLIAWAFTFPDHRLRFGPVAVGGPPLAYLVFALTLAFALFYGLGPFLPEMLAAYLALFAMTSLPRLRTSLRHRFRRAG